MHDHRENRKRIHQRHWILLFIPLVILAAVLLIFTKTNKEEVHNAIPEELTPTMTYEILNIYPHDSHAYTQGLVYYQGYLYESTGLYGESSLRQADLETGQVLKQIDLPLEFFGEGLALYADKLYQLTWREGTGFVYNLDDFELMNQFSYPMAGWGLTNNHQQLILSDGTNNLYFINPNTSQISNSVAVTYQGQAIRRLNELEYIRGEIFANIYQTDEIVRINPNTGEVMGWIDMRGILPEDLRTSETGVLNGIAYDPESDRLFITGKNWPKLYEIRLIPIPPD